MAETVIDNKNPSLETVNQNLLRKLNKMLESLGDEDTQGLLDITEAVAKLNGSFRNNDKLSQPVSEKEQINTVVKSKFGSRLSEAVVLNGD